MSTDSLFSPLQLGPIQLPNRIIMAPLTRMRAGADHVPTALNAEYYAQRASAGLIISEGTAISPEAHGYPSPLRAPHPSRLCLGGCLSFEVERMEVKVVS